MTVLSATEAHAFAAEWVAAWNAHDVERVLTHYTDDVEMASPIVVSVMGEPSGVVRGKAALRAYWTKALATVPDLHFETIDVLAGAGALTIYYRGHRGTVAETFYFDAAPGPDDGILLQRWEGAVAIGSTSRGSVIGHDGTGWFDHAIR